jgi:hypothetical protein
MGSPGSSASSSLATSSADEWQPRRLSACGRGSMRRRRRRREGQGGVGVRLAVGPWLWRQALTLPPCEGFGTPAPCTQPPPCPHLRVAEQRHEQRPVLGHLDVQPAARRRGVEARRPRGLERVQRPAGGGLKGSGAWAADRAWARAGSACVAPFARGAGGLAGAHSPPRRPAPVEALLCVLPLPHGAVQVGHRQERVDVVGALGGREVQG